MKRSRALVGVGTLGLLALVAASSSAAGFKKRSFQRSYRAALALYAAGDSSGAVTALVEAETGALAEAGGDPMAALRQAELEVIRKLLPAGPALLLPVAGLHEEAYLVYVRQTQAALISHAREMVVELARLVARHWEGEEGNAEASRILTSLAGRLQTAKVDSVAVGLYRQALVLDEQNRAALLGLSFLHEQYGEYAEAMHYLESLVEIDPQSGAAQLRLGVMYLRQGREETAATYLRAVLAPEYPSWMRSVAYQELGRLLLDLGRAGEARALLETGVRELPADPSLLIQLAYLSERNGYYSEDPALQQAIRSDSSDSPDGSPRYQYSQLPSAALASLRRDLAADRENGLETLATALAATDKKKGVG